MVAAGRVTEVGMVVAVVAEDAAGRVAVEGCVVAEEDEGEAVLAVGMVFMGAVGAGASFSLRVLEL